MCEHALNMTCHPAAFDNLGARWRFRFLMRQMVDLRRMAPPDPRVAVSFSNVACPIPEASVVERCLIVWMRDVLGGSDHEESFGQDARV